MDEPQKHYVKMLKQTSHKRPYKLFYSYKMPRIDKFRNENQSSCPEPEPGGDTEVTDIGYIKFLCEIIKIFFDL